MVEPLDPQSDWTAACQPPGTTWVGELVARCLGLQAQITYLERRPRYDLYRATAAERSALIKVGPPSRMRREAANLRQAAGLVGDLAPSVLGLVEPPTGPSLLVVELLPGVHVGPGRLSTTAWRRLVDGLLRLHRHGPGGPRVCFPLADDFVTLSASDGRFANLFDLELLLGNVVTGVQRFDARAALGLFEALVAEFKAARPAFAQVPRFVHADIWPENVLVSRGQCWLLDWTSLKPSDYALDLADLKLMLDWVWPAWRAQRAFEDLLRRYATLLGDTSLWLRLRVFMPLMSLIHLVRIAQDGTADPYTVECMRACLATAGRDRALWSLDAARQRILYAATHPAPSEYGVYADRPVVARAGRMLARLLASRRVPGGNGSP